MIFKILKNKIIWKSYSRNLTLHDAHEEQINLKYDIDKFKESTKPRKPRQKR